MLLGCVGLTSITLGLSAPASGAAYRYWTYWSGAGSTWTFSQVGPASALPKDGSVEGWRFAISTGIRGEQAKPRIDPASAFTQFCSGTQATPKTKRVAVVFDFGDASEAPSGQQPPLARGVCTQLPLDAVGSSVLRAAADVRVEAGLICAIADYPVGECAPSTSASPSPTQERETATNQTPPKDVKKTPNAKNDGAVQGNPPTAEQVSPGKQVAGKSQRPVSASESAPSQNRDGKGSDASGAAETHPTATSAGASTATDRLLSPTKTKPTPSDVTFATADARAPEATTQWLPMAIGGVVLFGLVGWIFWRRRASPDQSPDRVN